MKVNRLSPLWATLLLLGLQPQHFFSYRAQLPNVAAPSTYLGFYGALHLILFRYWLALLDQSQRSVSDSPLDCRFVASSTRVDDAAQRPGFNPQCYMPRLTRPLPVPHKLPCYA